MLKQFLTFILLISPLSFLLAQTSYHVQLGMHRVDMSNSGLKYQQMMSRTDFAKLTSMGIIRKESVLNVSAGGRAETNFQRITLGNYLDLESAMYVWGEVRKLGAKYPSIGFDKCFIVGNSGKWENRTNSFSTRSLQNFYTIQIASVRAINADEYAGLMREFGNVFFMYRKGVYQVCVGIFGNRTSNLQSQIIQRAKALGYTGAYSRGI